MQILFSNSVSANERVGSNRMFPLRWFAPRWLCMKSCRANSRKRVVTSSIEGSERQIVNTVVEVYADESCRFLSSDASLLELSLLFGDNLRGRLCNRARGLHMCMLKLFLIMLFMTVSQYLKFALTWGLSQLQFAKVLLLLLLARVGEPLRRVADTITLLADLGWISFTRSRVLAK